MAKGLYLSSFRLKNFKSVLDSGTIKFTPLTVFIGDNGVGKSSLIEGLQMFQDIVLDGLDIALQRWRGIEHIWHKGAANRAKMIQDTLSAKGTWLTNPIAFQVKLDASGKIFRLNYEPSAHNSSLDTVELKTQSVISSDGAWDWYMNKSEIGSEDLDSYPHGIDRWQFLELNPQQMGTPRPRQRASSQVQLLRDGSNVAEYLLSIRDQNQEAFNGIIETLMYVLPYAKDLQPSITSELERTVYLQLTELDYKIPGWLLSSGTLRVLALLCVLRHPTPPPIIFIEELENGLDPRTLNLIVEEIRRAVENGITQVVITTHSPYLLDLLSLSQIIVVERVNGQPVFTRPANQKHLAAWLEKFSPGQLYTMGRLRGVNS
ncbi:MAG: hypothetical protein RLZZ156_52 [Deinococcota bacterium]|jgi:predicted ATPase